MLKKNNSHEKSCANIKAREDKEYIRGNEKEMNRETVAKAKTKEQGWERTRALEPLRGPAQALSRVARRIKSFVKPD